ncbi:hypothetical protein L6R46_26780 [Myxococcota bacterium]|nr:hypothetical protein [Myxococcota bacterium]
MRGSVCAIWALGLVGCGADEPILSGLRVAPSAQAPGAPYVRPEHVLVDISYLGGRSWEEARDVVDEQLGPITERIDLDPRDGQELRFEAGALRVKDGQIYQITVTLPRPTRRAAALHSLNLPPQIDSWFSLDRELRARWEAGFERIRLGRAEPESEMIVWVEALKWSPRAQRGR